MAAGDLLESVRAGNRWLNAEPQADEVKTWFEEQVLHGGMKHDTYLGGIVVIAQTEKVKVTVENASGATFVREDERAAFTPYVKVDTRVRYFWDLVDLWNADIENGQEYFGVIEAVEVPRVTDPTSAFYSAHLPSGFSIHAERNENGSIKRFMLATFEAAIYERQSYLDRLGGKPAPAILRGRGTKQVPTNYRNGWADDAAMMKAETGAIGRALGVAGILVVGTGVASAEDVQEAITSPGGASGQAAPAATVLPPVVDKEGAVVGKEAVAAAEPPQEAAAAPEPTDEGLREHATALRAALEQESPEAWSAYVHWYTEERQFPALDQLKGSALKGAVVKLERTLDEVRGGAA